MMYGSINAQHPEHEQNIHKYITYQAWELVKAQHPEVINSAMNHRIGHWQDGSINGTGPWQKGMVITGAYREDEEDVMYKHSYPYTSATHFWDADLGDFSTFNPPPYTYNYKNAYQKLQSYWTGKDGNNNWLEIGPFFYNLIPYYIRVKYDSLHNAYRDHDRFLVTHWLDIGTGNWYAENPPMPMADFLVKNSNNYSRAEAIALSRRICWEVVGRMCHLIEDSGIPAHAHNDPHPFGDYFETYYMPQSYSNYTWQNALMQGGLININNKAYPLRYALYTTNQIADRFSSDDFYGNENLFIPSPYGSENYPQLLSPIYNDISAHGIFTQTSPLIHAPVAAEKLFVYTIRSVAGFLWYVYNKFGITEDIPPAITGFDYNLPDQYIFAGETLTLKCNATGTNLNYDWVVKVCDTSKLCMEPVPGLSVTKIGNTIRIRNDNFRNFWTCLKYDSLCSGGGTLSAPDPLHIYVGVKVYNDAGSVRKFYGLNRLISIHPSQYIRPVPISGCPMAYVDDGDKMAFENNILDKSEFPENKDKDISDLLVIRSVPSVNPLDSTVTIAIGENSIDKSFFDSFSLLSVVHPKDKKLMATNDGRLAIVDPNEILSPLAAELDGKDVTEILQYKTGGGKYVQGNEKSNLAAKFSASYQSDDTISLIFDASPPRHVVPIVKDAAGEITATDADGNTTTVPIQIAVRQNTSEILCVLPGFTSVQSMEMFWKREFGISYVGMVRLEPVPVVENCILQSAQDVLQGDVTALLTSDDSNYAALDSSSSIFLKFKVPIQNLSSGTTRSYVLTTKGRYEKPAGYFRESGMQISKTLDEATYKDEHMLLPNSPNPFNPSTIIKFYLASDEKIDVRVYDITGKEVARIISGLMQQGSHSVFFNGSTLSSGAYYIRFKAGDVQQVRRMMLVK